MQNSVKLSLLALTLTSLSCSQQETTSNDFTEEVDFAHANKFINGYILKTKSEEDETGAIVKTTTYAYDQAGMITIQTERDSGGTAIVDKEVMTLSTSNNMPASSLVDYQNNGSNDATLTYLYTKNSLQLVTSDFSGKTNGIYDFNSAGHIINYSIDYANDGSVDWKETYIRDSANKLQKIERDTNNDGTVDNYFQYSSNNDGSISRTFVINGSVSDDYSKYFFDSNGNMTRVESYNDAGELFYKITYSYEIDSTNQINLGLYAAKLSVL